MGQQNGSREHYHTAFGGDLFSTLKLVMINFYANFQSSYLRRLRQQNAKPPQFLHLEFQV